MTTRRLQTRSGISGLLIACAFGSLLMLYAVAPARAADPLLETIADDVAIAVQLERLDRVFPPEQLEGILKGITEIPAAANKIEAAIRKFPGRVALALTPQTEKQKEMITDVAFELGGDAGAFDEWVEKSLISAIEAIGNEPGRIKLEASATIRRITDARRDETVFAYSVRDRIAFGSTRPQRVQHWLRGEFPAKKWVQLPGSRRTIARLEKDFTARVIFNPNWLRQQFDKPKPNTGEAVLHTILNPDDLLSAVMELHWTRSALSAQVTLALVDRCEGIARVLQQPATPSAAIGSFPDDFVAVGRIAIPSFSALADGIYAITDRFDPTIGEEYREDLATFQTETGVDWKNDIAANIAGEITFGVRVDFTQMPPIGWAVVCPLADEATFNASCDRLTAHFELPLKTIRRDNFNLRQCTAPPFVMTTAANRWIIGDSPRTVAQLAAARGGERPVSKNLQRLYQALGEANQMAFMVDLGVLRQKAPMALMAVPPALTRLLAGGAVGVSLTNQDNLARINFRWDLPGGTDRLGRDRDAEDTNANTLADGGEAPVDGGEAAAMLISTLVSSVSAARIEAQKAASMANLRGIGMGIHSYAQRHKDAFPPDLSTLLREGVISLDQFQNPYTGEKPQEPSDLDRSAYVVYRPGLTSKSDPREIILAERTPQEGGACFLFIDGHVEFIAEPRASELIGLLLQGAESIRP